VSDHRTLFELDKRDTRNNPAPCSPVTGTAPPSQILTEAGLLQYLPVLEGCGCSAPADLAAMDPTSVDSLADVKVIHRRKLRGLIAALKMRQHRNGY